MHHVLYTYATVQVKIGWMHPLSFIFHHHRKVIHSVWIAVMIANTFPIQRNPGNVG